ncbi:MAG TPA: hypothetical protein VI911_10250 [Patescibacteria group bacterium]|nr:hypothetical protein [Patescibacteria group bacterium]
MYFFTSDEHYSHSNIIKYCNRPFNSIDEMNRAMTARHNEVVTDDDIVVHCGDFTMNREQHAKIIIRKLNGRHIFITGSHDKWIKNFNLDTAIGEKVLLVGSMWERKFDNVYLVACHYAMRKWPRSHYESIQVYGHSHGNLPPEGRQLDVGVDVHNFYPISLDQVIQTINLNQGNTNGKASPSSRV